MKRLKGYLLYLPMVAVCAAIALLLYSMIRPEGGPASVGPIESDHIFEHDGRHGHRLKPNLRNARGVLPARPHPLPFQPHNPAYADRITKRTEYYCSTNADSFRGTVEYERQPAPGVVRIGTIGDSITFGYGVADDESYPAVLEQLLDEHGEYEVINAGVHGFDSTKGLHALETRLLPYNPHIVTFCLGVNDTVSVPEHAMIERARLYLTERQYQDMEKKFLDNMNEAVDRCQAQGTRVVLMVPSVNSFFPFPDVERMCVLVRRLAAERNLPLVDLEEEFRTREETDGLMLYEEDNVQRLVQYRKGKPKELLTARVDPNRFQYVADEVYDYIDRKPVDMALAFDGSHPNAPGMRVIAEVLEPVILEVVEVADDLPPAD